MDVSLGRSLPLIEIDPYLWEALADIALCERLTVDDLLALINGRRATAIAAGHPSVTLASAVRVFVVAYLRLSSDPLTQGCIPPRHNRAARRAEEF